MFKPAIHPGQVGCGYISRKKIRLCGRAHSARLRRKSRRRCKLTCALVPLASARGKIFCSYEVGSALIKRRRLPSHSSRRSSSSRTVGILGLAFAVTGLIFALTHNHAAYGSDQDLRKLNQFVQGSQNSPSMQIFREGRDLIEQEQWAQAAEKFNGFIVKYPKDKNVDAALYWLVYALKKRGMFREATQNLDRLTREFPNSNWTNEGEAMLTEIAPQLGNRRVIEEGLNKNDDEIKIVALQSLFESSPERAVGYVSELLRPGSKASPELKEAAVSLLGSHGGKQALPLLLEIARNQPETRLREVAIHRLGESGDPRAVEFSKEVLSK